MWLMNTAANMGLIIHLCNAFDLPISNRAAGVPAAITIESHDARFSI
jgi:hypothetical protein